VRLRRRSRPGRERAHVVLAHVARAGTAQQVLEQDLHRVRQARNLTEPELLEPRQAEDLDGSRVRLQPFPHLGELAGHAGSFLSTVIVRPLWRARRAIDRARGSRGLGALLLAGDPLAVLADRLLVGQARLPTDLCLPLAALL